MAGLITVTRIAKSAIRRDHRCHPRDRTCRKVRASAIPKEMTGQEGIIRDFSINLPERDHGGWIRIPTTFLRGLKELARGTMISVKTQRSARPCRTTVNLFFNICNTILILYNITYWKIVFSHTYVDVCCKHTR